MDLALRTQITIPLSVPVPVPGADGKAASRAALVMRRPKLREAKRLAALVGRDLLSALLGETGGELTMEAAAAIDGRALATKVIAALLDRDALDELTAIVADMCGETPETVDQVDLVDLLGVGEAFIGFFPALRGAAPGS